MNSHSAYVGRFAPSPTGPLHFGSLVAALGSYLDARHQHGTWLLRIEDLDPPRDLPDAPAEIMAQLTAYGLTWDGDVLFQSNRQAAYAEHLASLNHQGLVFPCICTRKQVGNHYEGACRSRSFATTAPPYAVRVKVTNSPVDLDDLILGDSVYDLSQDPGDFIVRRKDGFIAYQLAVIVDDAYQGITRVVRGADLLTSTPRQIYLASLLSLSVPEYAHLPVVLGHDGDKLSKQTRAAPISTVTVLDTLRMALHALGQEPLRTSSPTDLLAAAIARWDLRTVPASPRRFPDDFGNAPPMGL